MSEESKRSFLLSRFKSDPLAVDFTVSCFCAALHSYRHDTVLKPFPNGYIEQDLKDFAKLKKHVNCIQKVTNVESLHSLPSDVVELMYWILEARKFKVKSCSKDKFPVIEALTGQILAVPPPNFVFEVVYNNSLEEKFEELREDKPLLYAYHGSRMENFYSILNHGLQQNLSKNALFGEGIYCSGELSVSLPYSPTGAGWEKSIIGEKLSCIAVCEIIDDPSGVKCQEKDLKTGVKSRSHIAGSMGGEIPEKYYVVRNNDLLRIKYLLVYADKAKSKGVNSWLADHTFTVIILFYALLLLAIGLYNSKAFHAYFKKLFL